MNTSPEIDAFAEALCKAQGEMGGASKDSANPFFKSKFADLASVIDAIRAPFAAHGLCFIQGTSYADGTVTVTTRLMHNSGQWVESSLATPVVKQDPQGLGSAISYAKRYNLQSLCGIPSVDDDGESAMVRQVEQTISAAEVAQLRASFAALEMDEARIGEHYGITSIEQMTAPMFEHVKNIIQKRSEAAA